MNVKPRQHLEEEKERRQKKVFFRILLKFRKCERGSEQKVFFPFDLRGVNLHFSASPILHKKIRIKSRCNTCSRAVLYVHTRCIPLPQKCIWLLFFISGWVPSSRCKLDRREEGGNGIFCTVGLAMSAKLDSPPFSPRWGNKVGGSGSERGREGWKKAHRSAPFRSRNFWAGKNTEEQTCQVIFYVKLLNRSLPNYAPFKPEVSQLSSLKIIKTTVLFI